MIFSHSDFKGLVPLNPIAVKYQSTVGRMLGQKGFAQILKHININRLACQPEARFSMDKKKT